MILNYSLTAATLSFDTSASSFSSAVIGNLELIAQKTPVFTISLLDKKGNRSCFSAVDASKVSTHGNEIVYEGFSCDGLTVTVTMPEEKSNGLYISVKVPAEACCEWVDFPRMALKPLCKNGGPGKILFPFNEGALIDNVHVREASPAFHHWEAGYPSQGCYAVFPNMVFSQFLAYVTESGSLYVGAHDEKRGVKQIDFYPQGENVILQNKVFTGTTFGRTYVQDFPWVICGAGSTWYQAADVYKTWLRSHMPENMPKIKDNPKIPAWYKESPVVISYPVRGIHDMDRMTPNALFPYTNALPMIRSIQEKTHSKIMVLLMHWEGTAPWAPPYVWPPYGGEKPFQTFRDALHKEGNLLGVYCSGFGFTKHSNLTDYEGESLLRKNHYLGGMCAAPSGRVKNSLICCAQRSGYDICPASDIGKSILNEAYQPLFENDLDYAQILDQNHGGGQYFCYGKNHGHAPVPGAWMTENMQNFLGGWNATAGQMLLGCESAAAEPFIPHLLFSDNRYELCYDIGEAIPLYGYLFHEYVRNFMGNQVSCPFSHEELTLPYRLAYSFAAGDAMTLVMTPDGQLMTNWGDHDFTNLPDYGTVIDFVGKLQLFYREKAHNWLFDGNMIEPLPVFCDKVVFHHRNGRPIPVDAVVSTAWEKDGQKAQIFLNHTAAVQSVRFRRDGKETVLSLEPYSAELTLL